MAGIYDWVLNSLKSDQSPLTNQLPTPIPTPNLTGLPVPYQEMPSESAFNNSLLKMGNMLVTDKNNPQIPQDTGTTPTTPNDPLKTYMLQQYMSKLTSGMMNKAKTALPVIPTQPVNAGNPTQPNFTPTSPTSFLPNGQSPNMRAQMLMKMLMQGNSDASNGGFN